MNISELSKEIHQNAVDKGFWDKERNFGEMLTLIVSELSEALEAHRENKWCQVDVLGVYGWKDDVAFLAHYKETVRGTVEEELADATIRILDLCKGMNIDIQHHALAKMRYNKSRERMHNKAY